MKSFLTRHGALIIIIVVAFSLRLYKINNPILDWHSFRQADTASVTREYVKHGIDILHPRYHDLANIQSGHENLEGYRMVEFPFLNVFTAFIIKIVPFFTVELTHRFISIFFSLGTLVLLFFFTKEISGIRVAYSTAIVFAALPFSVYYSRSILPEPALLFFFIAALYTSWLWFKTKKLTWFVISFVSLILALLLKPFVLFFFPLFIAIGYVLTGKKVLKNYLLYTLLALSVVPLLLWRNWIEQFPSGIPASDWLFDGFVTQLPDWLPKNPVTEIVHKLFGYNTEGLRYHPAWIRWLVYERMTKLILGFAGVVFLISALYKLKKKELYLLGTWWVCTALYFTIVARGNVQHDYYQVLVIPLLSWTVGRGMVVLENLLSKKLKHLTAFLTVLVLFLSSLALSWNQVSGYFAVNHPEYVQAGATVDRLTPPDAKVIAPAFGDTMFLYQTNRTGWPIGYHIDEKIEYGATHYISTSYDEEAKMLEEKYFTIEKTPVYILIDLTRTNNDSL